MNLGPSTPIGRFDGHSVPELLTELSAGVRGRNSLLVEEWVAITAWADQNTIDCTEGAATLVDGVIDTGVPIAGEGAPLVSEFALMELIAVLERSPDSGRGYVGRVIECAWRLPLLYAAVVAGKVAPWRAERVADLTRPLSAQAAAFVDRHLNAAIGGVGWKQLERLVAEAVMRFDPERAEAERQKAADQRRFGPDEVDEHGQVRWDGVLDAADSLDLDQAISREAEIRGRFGDDSPLDVRRSKAAGAIARRDLALDLLIHDEETGEVVAEAPGRKVVLNVHITDTSLGELIDDDLGGEVAGVSRRPWPASSTNEDDGDLGGEVAGVSRRPWPASSTNEDDAASSTNEDGNPVGRCEETGMPVTIGQIKEWLLARHTTVTIRPVIDLADCVPVDSYEIPDRLKQRVRMRDHTCRFPGCPRRAVKCDIDHHTPYAQGGPTCPCQLVPLCRRHHRAKTFSLWRYVIIAPAHYLWISPSGRHFHVGPLGTTALDPPRWLDPDDYDGY
ncbi:MAG TPA: HNH endonuclease signature motif containing protein [Nocardioides sp.]|nr:HNH endonuclease signature motif containing protein [Nocardioides sp.]